GKIDRRLNLNTQLNQLFGQFFDALRKGALQRTQRIARGLLGAGFDEVGNGLGLRQVQLVVEKGALTEFAGARQSGAELDAAGQQHVEHHRATVTLQFQYVFAGKRVGPGEVQQQAFIQHLRLTMESAVMGMPWPQLTPANGLGNAAGQWPGDPYDAYSAATRRGGD